MKTFSISSKKILKKVSNKILVFSLSFLSIFSASADIIPSVSIDCSNSTCVPSFTVNDNHPGNDYNAIDVGSNSSNIGVTVQSKQAPRNLRMSVINGSFPDGTTNPGFDLNVNLTSTTPNSGAGSFVLLGDNFKNLNLQLNGYVGSAGKDSSKLCGDKIKAGLYGADALSFFNNLRLNDSSIDKTRCSLDDINYLQSSKFSCPSGFNEVLTSNSVYSVNIQRIPKINRCQTSLTYDVCLRRKTQISCQWTIYSGNASLYSNLVAGSNQIINSYSVKANVNAGQSQLYLSSNPTGVFVGQTVTGPGIPASTTVTGISGSTINLSQAVQQSGSNLPFLIGVTTGQVLFGPGIPTGTTITGIQSNGATIDLSNNATTTNNIVPLSSSSPTNYGANIGRIVPENEYYYLRNIMSDSDICSLHVAQEISNSSYNPQGASAGFLGNITAQSPTISNVSNFSASTTINSPQIVFNSLPQGIVAGVPIYGPGIPTNSIIQSINNSIITLSAPATITSANALLFAGPQVGQTILSSQTNGIQSNTTITGIAVATSSSGSTTIGTKNITGIVDSSVFIVDQIISGPNLSAGSFITTIPDGQTLTISQPAIASGVTDLSSSNSIIMNTNSTLTQTNGNFSSFSQNPVVNPLYSNANDFAGCTGSCFWKVSAVASTLTTPGMIGDQLAPGSNWELVNTIPGQQCDSSTNAQSGFFSTYKSISVNYVAYDSTDSSCKVSDIVTYSGGTPNHSYPAQSIDPNKQAVWFYSGQAQEPDFGTEIVQCDLGNCPVSSVVSDLVQGIDTIAPTNGEQGTQQGNAQLFIYDAQNISTSDLIGVAGAGGKNDIINQATTRVCSKVRDALSDGLASDYARTPLVSFDRFNWQAIKTAASGNPGQQPINNGNSITIWKKVDSSVRQLLQNELFHQ